MLFLNLFPMKNLQIWQKIYTHAELNFKLVRIIYILREKRKCMWACSWKLHNLLENNNTKRLNKIEKVKNIMWACQGVNLLLFMMKVWTELNTALFSSSFRLTEPKISRFSEIVSGMSKREKKSCCLKSRVTRTI
jgi:hypothetical protein